MCSLDGLSKSVLVLRMGLVLVAPLQLESGVARSTPSRAGIVVPMLAWLQRLITGGLLFAALGIGWWVLSDGLPAAFGAFFVFLLLCLVAYASALAVEFVLARLINARTACPIASWQQVRSAWWNEVITGPLLFCWRQPFRTNAVPDNLVCSTGGYGQQGVVFVHGFFCNRAFWSPWMTRLKSAGRVYEAISLEPVFGSIDDYLRPIDNAIRRVAKATGVPPLLVCHSMGGLAVRAWLAEQPADGPAYRVVTLGTPHHGTWLARWGRSTNARQMQLGSGWLSRLNSVEGVPAQHQFTCWYSTTDNIVFPSSSATLPGADNRELNGVAHVQMAFLPQVIDETLVMLKNSAV